MQTHPALRVMIAMQDHIATQGVERLLQKTSNLTILRASSIDESTVMQETEQAQPEVLILDNSDALHGPLQLIGLLEMHPGMRIVVVSLEDNHAWLYERHDIELQTESDFLNVIHGSNVLL